MFFPIDRLRGLKNLSERVLAARAGVSRRCLRQMARREGNATPRSVHALAKALDRDVTLVAAPAGVASECSTVAAAYKVERDGFASWKIHYMDLVDEFRRGLDSRLILLPPPRALDERLAALMASIVRQLCIDNGMEAPGWSRRRRHLDAPWFVSGAESLKATAIVESPLAFRGNNIFVLANFLERM